MIKQLITISPACIKIVKSFIIIFTRFVISRDIQRFSLDYSSNIKYHLHTGIQHSIRDQSDPLGESHRIPSRLLNCH